MKSFFPMVLFLIGTSTAMASDMISVDCQGKDVKFTLKHFLDETSDLFEITISGTRIATNSVTTNEVGSNLDVQVLSGRKKFSFAVTLPKDDNGVIISDQKTPSIFVVKTKRRERAYPVQCQSTDLTQAFFDALFTGFAP